jgi:hypothetical protein
LDVDSTELKDFDTCDSVHLSSIVSLLHLSWSLNEMFLPNYFSDLKEHKKYYSKINFKQCVDFSS